MGNFSIRNSSKVQLDFRTLHANGTLFAVTGAGNVSVIFFSPEPSKVPICRLNSFHKVCKLCKKTKEMRRDVNEVLSFFYFNWPSSSTLTVLGSAGLLYKSFEIILSIFFI